MIEQDSRSLVAKEVVPPRISIVTPSYNQAPFLERTIKSVLDQRYPCLEYIIIDGGSSDGSVDIIKRYEKYLSYWISEKDKGQSHAINKGFERASGQILAYLNSDDTYVEGTLLFIADYFSQHPEIDVVYGNATFIDEEDCPIRDWRTIDYKFNFHLYGQAIIPQPSAFWRKEIYTKVGKLDESLQLALDGDLWFRMSKRGAKFAFCDTVLSNFRVHNQAKSIAFKNQHINEAQRVRENINAGNFSKFDKLIRRPATKVAIRGRRLKLNMSNIHKPQISPHKIKRYFDRDSTEFADNRWFGSPRAQYDYALTKEFLQRFLGPTSKDNILEIGCGPGVWTGLISPKCQSITAVDISSEMIAQARRRVGKDNATFVHGDFISYQTKKYYDKVFSVRVIEYFENLGDVVSKISRLNTPDGKAIIITKTVPTVLTARSRVSALIKKMAIWKNQPTGDPELPMQLISPHRLKKLFLANGYEHVEVYPLVLRTPFFVRANYPLPFVGRRLQSKYKLGTLKYLNRMARKTVFLPETLRYPFFLFSETYLLYATKQHIDENSFYWDD